MTGVRRVGSVYLGRHLHTVVADPSHNIPLTHPMPSKSEESKAPNQHQLCRLLRQLVMAARREPRNLRLRLKIAEVLRRLGNAEEAIPFYRSVAMAYGMHGNLASAITLCQLILELKPDHRETQSMLAKLYASKRLRAHKRAVPVRLVAGRWVVDPWTETDKAPTANDNDLCPASHDSTAPGTAKAKSRRPQARPTEGSPPGRPSSTAEQVQVAPAYADVERSVQREAEEVSPEALSSGELDAARGALGDTARDLSGVEVGSSTTQRIPVLPLFSGLSTSAFVAMINKLARRRCARGTLVVREGEPGESLLLVSSGRLQVVKNDGGHEIELARLGAGTFFGEFAVLTDRRRHASVRCLTDCELLELKRDELERLCNEHPSLLATLWEFYHDRVMKMVTSTSTLFRGLDEDACNDLIDRFERRQIRDEEIVVREGDASRCFYVVLSGEVAVTCLQDDGSDLEVARLGEGDYFGELSLVSGQPAQATVKATRRVTELLSLEAAAFYAVAAEHPQIWQEVQREGALREQQNQRLRSARMAEAVLL